MLVRNGLFSLPLSLVVDLFFSYLGESGDLEYVQPNEEEGYIFKKRRFTTEDEIEKVDLGRVGKYLEEDILIELKKYPEGIVLRELRRITQNREILEEFSKKIRMYQTHTPLL